MPSLTDEESAHGARYPTRTRILLQTRGHQPPISLHIMPAPDGSACIGLGGPDTPLYTLSPTMVELVRKLLAGEIETDEE